MYSTLNIASSVGTNILSLVLLLVTVVGSRWRLEGRNRESLSLTIIALCILFSNIIDPCTYLLDGVPGDIANFFIHMTNSWLFLANIVVAPCWVYFAASHLQVPLSRSMRILTVVISVFCLALVVVNPEFKIIFDVTENNVYVRGSGYQLVSIVALVFVVMIMWLYMKARRRGGVQSIFPVWALALPIVVAVVIQAVFYGISVVWLGICISYAGVMLCLQNDIIYHDSLTGLPNRTAVWRYARSMMDAKPECDYTVVVSDIENFKGINERLGVLAGDKLLKYVGKSLNKFNSKDAVFGRYSNDKFVGVMRMPAGAQRSEADDSFMLAAMEGMYAHAPVDDFTVKFGIYDNVDKSLHVSAMCDRAFLACEGIKREHGVFVAHYTEDMGEAQALRSTILEDMEYALSEKQFSVYYQPKHDAHTGEVVGAEALVRWIHPKLGFMPPDKFLEVFESTGFVTQLDYYVFKQVLNDIARWISAGHKAIPISVNTSRKDYFYKDYLQYVMAPFEASGVDPSLVHLEITESAFVDRPDALIDRVAALRAQGLKVELDDFGSGYSTLGTLAQFPLDIVKLDMTFMRAFDKQKPVVESAIELCHKLDFKVIAEGVETAEQLAELDNLGCDYIQGYYFSKPLARDEFEAYLIEHGL